jgi:hypothetical protein
MNWAPVWGPVLSNYKWLDSAQLANDKNRSYGIDLRGSSHGHRCSTADMQSPGNSNYHKGVEAKHDQTADVFESGTEKRAVQRR